MDRILSIKDNKDLAEELKKIKVSTQGIQAMYKKGITLPIKLKDIKIGAANIIKQDMLSIGGDAAVARGVVNGKLDRTDVIIFGDEKKIKILLDKLSFQNIFEIPTIINSIDDILHNLNQPPLSLKARGKKISLQNTQIMGIVNVTPDSFYDGGKYNSLDRAKERIDSLVEQGADMIDVGGESTRPFAAKVNSQEEIDRVVPVIEAATNQSDLSISIDTYKSRVAEEALRAGADIVNDISGLAFDDEMKNLLAKHPDVPLVIMHIQGTPQNMQKDPHYQDVIEDIFAYFQKRIDIAIKAGIKERNIIIDPGIGFGKKLHHNTIILNKIAEFKALGRPLLLGCSNKSFLGDILGAKKNERLPGTLAATAFAVMQGVQILRVHEVKENKMAARTMDYLRHK